MIVPGKLLLKRGLPGFWRNASYAGVGGVDTHGKRGLSYLKIGLRKLMRILHLPKLLRIWIRLSPLLFDYEAEAVSVSRKENEETARRKRKCEAYEVYD